MSDPAAGVGGRPADVRRMAFDDNALLAVLYGHHDRHLVRIEQLANVQLSARGNQLAIAGASEDAAVAHKAIAGLYERLKRGLSIEMADIDAAVRFARSGADGEGEGIRTRRRTVQARTPGQRGYLQALHERDMVFALGPAGSGKTYLAVAMGVSLLIAGKVERIVLSRPAVEAGERLGFLPGDMKEKIDPYLRPLYDALHDMLPAEQIANRMESGEIEIAPLAFMRGRTLAHCLRDSRRGTEHHADADAHVPDPPGRRLAHGDHRRSQPDRPARRPAIGAERCRRDAEERRRRALHPADVAGRRAPRSRDPHRRGL